MRLPRFAPCLTPLAVSHAFTARTRTTSLGILLTLVAHAHAALQPGASAQIISVQGAGEQRPPTSSDWQDAHAAQPLAAGAYVRTHEAARMALLLADETQVRLNQNTVLQVKSIEPGITGSTLLRLESGRAWAQTRRPVGNTLQMQTPAATAAIRGTDWEISVAPDGRTLLTVLSGHVELTNAQGQVEVGPNEAAMAEIGKAPVKLVITQPRERVQWVNALQADPLPHLDAAPPPGEWLPVTQALRQGHNEQARQALEHLGQPGDPWRDALERAIDLREGQVLRARTLLARQWQEPQAPLVVALMLSDLQLMLGEGQAAHATLLDALRRAPRHPALLAQLARQQTLDDDLVGARATLAQASDPDNASIVLTRAWLEHREGHAAATLSDYTVATRVAPQDARGWQGLGSAQAELEDLAPAREHLRRALALDAHVSGAQGEMGTLETQANQFGAAQAAFDAALKDQPGDYVALTGLGLLRLKQGQPEAALDAFLRAGTMQPRYARAKVWMAVAYYQLGRTQDAIFTLQQASALDEKDPIPWMLLAQIHIDYFEPADAVQAAREALARMPYLKSLNQLANDQKGSANLGAALAFFGLQDWALELAQQSFSPYWGASHLFLADRYAGEFAKNSELFQGFLTDPLAFGASPGFSSLLQRPGAYGVLEWMGEREFHQMSLPSVTLNGLDNRHVPLAWFVKAQQVNVQGYPIDVGVDNAPLLTLPDTSMSGTAQVLTLGFGLEPHEQLKLFAYLNSLRLHLAGNNDPATRIGHENTQGVLGASWRWRPGEQTWFKLGRNLTRTSLENYPTLFIEPPAVGLAALEGEPHKAFSDVQWRHSVDLQPGTRVAATFEHIREEQSSETAALGLISGQNAAGQTVGDTLAFVARNAIERRYSALTLEGEHRLAPGLSIDGALALQEMRNRVQGLSATALIQADIVRPQQVDVDETQHIVSPRLGLVWQPTQGQTVRLAWQDWVRPPSVSTLTRVDTAGIPVEDGLLQSGGRYQRAVAQWGAELGRVTYVALRADHLRARNPTNLGVDLRTPTLPFLEEMRNTQLANLSSSDLLEGTPNFTRAEIDKLAVSINRMMDRHWSVYASAQHQRARIPDEPGLRVSWLPRHTAVLGTTWASSARVYLSARAVWRATRYEDAANLTPRPAGWSVDLMGFWESADKHWQVGAAALNLWGPKSTRQKARLILDARYRF